MVDVGGRACGCITFPAWGLWGADPGARPPGVEALGVIDGAEGPGGVADEGLDQPGPAVEEDCGAVSFAATRREWDVEGWTVGLAG